MPASPNFPNYPDESRYAPRQDDWWILVTDGYKKGDFCGGPSNHPSIAIYGGSIFPYLLNCGDSPILGWGRELSIKVLAGDELILRKIEGTYEYAFDGIPNAYTVPKYKYTTIKYYFYTKSPNQAEILRYPRIITSGTTLTWQQPIRAILYYWDEYIDSEGVRGNRQYSGFYTMLISERGDPPIPEEILPLPDPPSDPPPDPPPPCDIPIRTDPSVGEGYFCMSFSEYDRFIERNRRANERLSTINNFLSQLP